MNLAISISARAEKHMTLQYRRYLEKADEALAERHLDAVHETIQTVAT